MLKKTISILNDKHNKILNVHWIPLPSSVVTYRVKVCHWQVYAKLYLIIVQYRSKVHPPFPPKKPKDPLEYNVYTISYSVTQMLTECNTEGIRNFLNMVAHDGLLVYLKYTYTMDTVSCHVHGVTRTMCFPPYNGEYLWPVL